MKRTAAALILGPLSLLAIGCGSGGGKAGSEPTTATTATTSIAGGTSTTSPPTAVTYDPTTVYEGDVTVLQNASHGPEACYVVATSYPPQCGGIPVVGLDWNALPKGLVERSGQVVWAGLHVTGTYDGKTLRLTAPPTRSAPPGRAPTPDFATPCPAPTGGWAVRDPSKLGTTEWEALQTYASSQPDYVDLWLDQGSTVSGGAGQGQFAQHVVTVVFTGDVDRHERDLQARWGGALCVVRGPISRRTLEAAQARLTPMGPRSAAGVLSVGLTVSKGSSLLDVNVVVDNPSVRAWLRDRAGNVPMRVTGWLHATDTKGEGS